MNNNLYDQVYTNRTPPIRYQDNQDQEQIINDQEQKINPGYTYLFIIIMFMFFSASIYLFIYRYQLFNKSLKSNQYMSAVALSSPELGLITKSLLSFL